MKLLGCSLILLALFGVALAAWLWKRKPVESHQIPVSFACLRCKIVVPNSKRKRARRCANCRHRMGANYALTVTASVRHSGSLMADVFSSGSTRWKQRLKSYSQRFRRDNTMHQIEQLDDRSDASRGKLHKKHVVGEDGRDVKDVEGLMADPGIHGEVKRRLRPGSPLCSICPFYAMVRCVGHGASFCRRHGEDHLHAQVAGTDGLIELQDDLL